MVRRSPELYRGVYLRPSTPFLYLFSTSGRFNLSIQGLVYHAHFRPLTTPFAALLDLSATLHSAAPRGFPTPSSVLRALSGGRSESPFRSMANALTTPPIHVDHVAGAVVAALLNPNVRGVVDVLGMRELVGWKEMGQEREANAL